MLNEDKVMEYKGYSVYRVATADQDDFEIWKNGKKVGSCETEDAAKEFIDDALSCEEQIKLAAKVYLVKEGLRKGSSVRKSLNESDEGELGDLRTNVIQSLNALIGAHMQLLDDYYKLEEVDPSFADLFAEQYPFGKSFDDLNSDIISWRDHIMGEFVK